MRVLHIAPLHALIQNHLLTLLPALRGLGIKTELLVIFAQHPPSPVIMAGMKRGGVPMYGLKLPHSTDLIHPTTPQSIMEVAQFIQTRHADLIHTHLSVGDFLGGYGARWGNVPIRVSTRHDVDEDRSADYWRVVAGLFNRHIALSDALADAIHAEGVARDQITIATSDMAGSHKAVYQTVLRG
ncbi:MAG: glycosyltransferase [Anaerolineae bacterium]|nr:glycosyltransferase [Anaerolineae bacterium]